MSPEPTTYDSPVVKAIIADDQSLGRLRLRQLLREEKDIVIIAECHSGWETLRVINSELPDLAILSITMRDSAFFQFTGVLADNLPAILLGRGSSPGGLDLSGIKVLDHLISPLSSSRFKLAIARARQYLMLKRIGKLSSVILQLRHDLQQNTVRLSTLSFSDETMSGVKPLEQLRIKNGKHVFFVPVTDIDWIEADSDYVWIHQGSKRHIVRLKISELERQLDPLHFIRIHRSLIVQLSRIKEVLSLAPGSHQALLQDGTRLPISRNYKHRINMLRLAS